MLLEVKTWGHNLPQATRRYHPSLEGGKQEDDGVSDTIADYNIHGVIFVSADAS